MGMTLLFILQYDMSQEPSQPASQPYTGHVESSPDFIHHPQKIFGHSSMGHGQMFGHSYLSLATHQTPNSNMSLPRTISSRISQVMVLVHHRCLALQP